MHCRPSTRATRPCEGPLYGAVPPRRRPSRHPTPTEPAWTGTPSCPLNHQELRRRHGAWIPNTTAIHRSEFHRRAATRKRPRPTSPRRPESGSLQVDPISSCWSCPSTRAYRRLESRTWPAHPPRSSYIGRTPGRCPSSGRPKNLRRPKNPRRSKNPPCPKAPRRPKKLRSPWSSHRSPSRLARLGENRMQRRTSGASASAPIAVPR